MKKKYVFELQNKIFLINLMNCVWTYNIKYYLIIEKQLWVKYFIMDKDDENHWNNWDEDLGSDVQYEMILFKFQLPVWMTGYQSYTKKTLNVSRRERVSLQSSG